MEFENATLNSFQTTQITQTRPAYLRPTEYIHLFDAATGRRSESIISVHEAVSA